MRSLGIFLLLLGAAGPARADGPRVVEVVASASDVRAAVRLGPDLWLGTMGGLVRIGADGRAQHLTSLDGLPSHAVRALAVSPDGTLWAGTGRGLVALREGRVRRSLPGPAIVAVAVGLQGAVFAATADRQVVQVAGAQLAPVPVERTGTVYALACVGTDLYLGTSRGLRRWDGTRTTRVRGPLPDAAILALAPDGDTVLVGSPAGLSRVRGDRVVERSLAAGLRVSDVRAILPGPSAPRAAASLLVGTWGSGVYRVEGGRAVPLEGVASDLRVQALARSADQLLIGHGDGALLAGQTLALGWLPSNDVTALASIGDTLYVGTFDRGLVARTADGATRLYTEASGLLDDRVNALAVRDDALWIGLERGVCRLHARAPAPRGITCWRGGEGPAAGHVAALLAEASGVWVGSSAGLSRFDGRAWTAVPLPFDRVTALARSPGGALWVGSAEGLARLHPTSLAVEEVRTAASGGIPDDWVTMLAFDAGALWVGTYSSGLGRIESDGLLVTLDPSAWINPASAALAGASPALGGAHAFGGLDDGVLLVLGSRVDRVQAGLPSLDVTALLPQADGLWVATRGGLARLSASIPRPVAGRS